MENNMDQNISEDFLDSVQDFDESMAESDIAASFLDDPAAEELLDKALLNPLVPVKAGGEADARACGLFEEDACDPESDASALASGAPFKNFPAGGD